MGVPKFFKYISERYPSILAPLTENSIPSIDNLYLDMNGIIHVCSHGKGIDGKNINEDKLMLKIFNYIDKLFNLIKPKKTFFMAIDGVAPRAKMNQQRSRRFRASKALKEEKDKLSKEKKEELEEKEGDNFFDSNCITPGTEFMENLSQQLQFFYKKENNRGLYGNNVM